MKSSISKILKKLGILKILKALSYLVAHPTVTQKTYPSISKSIFEKNIPILGICYGLQLIAKVFGGRIKKSQKKREFGEAILFEKSKSLLFKNFFTNKKTSVWMSHQDAVIKIPKGFENLASTDSSKYTAIQNKKKIFTVYNFIQKLLILKKGLK